MTIASSSIKLCTEFVHLKELLGKQFCDSLKSLSASPYLQQNFYRALYCTSIIGMFIFTNQNKE